MVPTIGDADGEPEFPFRSTFAHMAATHATFRRNEPTPAALTMRKAPEPPRSAAPPTVLRRMAAGPESLVRPSPAGRGFRILGAVEPSWRAYGSHECANDDSFAKPSIHRPRATKQDCFAALAMTGREPRDAPSPSLRGALATKQSTLLAPAPKDRVGCGLAFLGGINPGSWKNPPPHGWRRGFRSTASGDSRGFWYCRR